VRKIFFFLLSVVLLTTANSIAGPTVEVRKEALKRLRKIFKDPYFELYYIPGFNRFRSSIDHLESAEGILMLEAAAKEFVEVRERMADTSRTIDPVVEYRLREIAGKMVVSLEFVLPKLKEFGQAEPYIDILRRDAGVGDFNLLTKFKTAFAESQKVPFTPIPHPIPDEALEPVCSGLFIGF